MLSISRSPRTWLARQPDRNSPAVRPPRSRRWTLTLEPLESRALLSVTTWTVNSLGDKGTGSGQFGDLRYCITQADKSPGNNTIIFSVTGTITLGSALPDLSNTTGMMEIEGSGAASLTVARSNNSQNSFAVFTVDANVQAQLFGLMISNGLSPEGGGIHNSGTLSISNCSISNNQAFGAGGAGIYNSGSLSVSNSSIEDNSGEFVLGGAGVLNAGTGTLTVTNSTIEDNTVNGFGNGGAVGGGIYNSGTLAVTVSTVNGNSAASAGGIYNADMLTVTGSNIDNNSAGNGSGGIYNVGTLIVDSSSINNNGGGGIYNAGALSVDSSSIDNNNTPTYGGGIWNVGNLTVSNTTINGNTSDYNGGGGIYNQGTMSVTKVTNSIIANNSASPNFGGGGIDNEGTLTVINSTLADNVAGVGGIYNAGKLAMINSTVAYNLGGIQTNGTATLDNTIVAQNFQQEFVTDISGVVASSSAYNLIGTGGSGGLANGKNGNQVGVADPGLGPLAYYGGPTQTIDLLTGSPAIDKGSNALAVDPSTGKPLATDQRGTGFQRIVNGTVDIGAYEFLPAANDTVAVTWGTQTAPLQTAADGLRLLPAGRNIDIPWLGIDSLQVTLSQAQTLTAAEVTVSSANGINYGPVTVSGSGTSYAITLAQPINAADRVTITIVNPGISIFNRRLDVLPGDVNDDGLVNVQDMVAIRNQILGLLGAVPTIFGDINGDGKVDILDYTAVSKLLGTRL